MFSFPYQEIWISFIYYVKVIFGAWKWKKKLYWNDEKIFHFFIQKMCLEKIAEYEGIPNRKVYTKGSLYWWTKCCANVKAAWSIWRKVIPKNKKWNERTGRMVFLKYNDSIFDLIFIWCFDEIFSCKTLKFRSPNLKESTRLSVLVRPLIDLCFVRYEIISAFENFFPSEIESYADMPNVLFKNIPAHGETVLKNSIQICKNCFHSLFYFGFILHKNCQNICNGHLSFCKFRSKIVFMQRQ